MPEILKTTPRRARLAAIVLLALATAALVAGGQARDAAAQEAARKVPLERAHAHND